MSKKSEQSESLSLNPFTGEVVGRYPHDSSEFVDKKLQDAFRGFKAWREISIDRRSEVLVKMAAVLRRDELRLAKLVTEEMGKPISQSRAEIAKCAALCDYYAEKGPAMLGDDSAKVPSGSAYVSYLPIGIVFAVMPWNFPFWQVMRGAVTILLGGNGYVLKHSSNVLGSAYALEAAWLEAGLPGGVFTVLNIGHEQSAKVIRDPRIAAVTVTGSVSAGRSVAEVAGSVLKKSVLELGGADAFIVLRDANLEFAVKSAIEARFQNTGQVCIAAKRFIVEESVLSSFTEMFVEKVKTLCFGDPMNPDVFIGPMAKRAFRDELQAQVLKSVAEGARVICGGSVKAEPFTQATFYEPTVIVDVEPGMTVFREEVFGPVAAISSARDTEHAIELANLSDFGLSAALWTNDKARAKMIARRLETGGVFINGMSATDAAVPVGGVKHSGYGRELSHFGMREFVNAQTVWIDRT